MLHQTRALQAEYDAPGTNLAERERLAKDDAIRASRAAAKPLRRGLLLDAYVALNDGSAQPFYRYLPTTWTPDAKLPLLVYLHGFVPTYDLLSPPTIPSSFTNLAERAGFAVVVPFGRSNTDFQGVGEQDVLHIIDLMQQRCNIDTNRVLIAGYSMGGMGAWQIASRWPDRFCGLFALGNRGDFYTWQNIQPTALPPWQRRIIDTQFAANWAHRLTTLPILAIHGENDFLMPLREARAIFDRVPKTNPNAKLILLPNTGHLDLAAQFTNTTVQAWLAATLTNSPNPQISIPQNPPRPGATGSRAQDLFLDPFIIVGDNTSLNARQAFANWYYLTKSYARLVPEADLTSRQLAECSLLLPATPEDSPLVARLLAQLGATVTPDSLTLAGRTFPRANRGFWIAAPSPENPRLTWLANFGLPWGARISYNHYYDRIPDFICYTATTGAFELPVPDAVAFLTPDGQLEWSDPPATPASTDNLLPAY